MESEDTNVFLFPLVQSCWMGTSCERQRRKVIVASMVDIELDQVKIFEYKELRSDVNIDERQYLCGNTHLFHIQQRCENRASRRNTNEGSGDGGDVVRFEVKLMRASIDGWK